MYSEMDDDSFRGAKDSLASNGVTECSTDGPVDAAETDRPPSTSEEKCAIGLSRLVSKNSEVW